jgi:phage repressor protein C with HTH and peptisase S24 domain
MMAETIPLEAMRLRELRERKKLSRQALAELAETSPGQIQKLEQGERKLTVEWMERLGPHVDAETADFVSAPPMAPTDVVEFDGREHTAIARYDAGLSSGPGSLIGDYPEPLGYQLIETQWLRAMTRAAPGDLCVVRVDGDSMQDTLFDGDWVLVDRTKRRISREGLYAIRVLDACWIKRISINLKEKLIRVISDNPKYKVDELSEEELDLLGRVVALIARKIV